jgi:hypothetical protein
MRRLVIPGTTFTYWNIFQCWGVLYGGMTVLFGILLLASTRAAKGDPALWAWLPPSYRPWWRSSSRPCRPRSS